MAPSRLRKALGAVKDHTTIGLAKVSTNNNTLSEIEVAIVKATRHDEQPAEEKHVREILSLTCYSRQHVTACVDVLSRRLSRTKNWTVALKTLVLIHRLCLDGDSSYEQEIFFATRRGTRILNLSDFRDTSRSDSWDFSAFVRMFALYLDERLEYRMQGKRDHWQCRSGLDDDDDERVPVSSSVRATPVSDMKTNHVFIRTHHLMQLLERFLACRPTGMAKNNRIVAVALYPVVKESYQMYYDLVQIMNILIDRFMELEIPECVRTHEIFTRISKLFDELDALYAWCKSAGIARPSDYPDVEKVTKKKLDVMDEFIRDKTTLASRKQQKRTEDNVELPPEEEQEQDCDMNKIKASPAMGKEDREKQKSTDIIIEEEVDLFNIKEDFTTRKEHGNDQLALALFNGDHTTTTGATTCSTKWEVFGDDALDWETALVQSASSLPNQKLSLGGGLNPLILDSMYQRQSHTAPENGFTGAGSASSMACPNRQGFMALPAPPVAGGFQGQEDPFAASLSVAPPSYVQISDMEKKQRYLMQEQVMWEQYARDRMQGQLGLAKVQPSHYQMMDGGYHHHHHYHHHQHQQQQQYRYY